MDWFLGGLALAAFAGFVAIVARFVPETDLVIVLAAAVLMAAFDFWRTMRAQQRRRRAVPNGRPTPEA